MKKLFHLLGILPLLPKQVPPKLPFISEGSSWIYSLSLFCCLFSFFFVLRYSIKRSIFFLAVLNELEGLARGADARDCPPASRATLDPEHVARVAESAKAALSFARSRNPAIRCLTTRGTVLTSSTFTVEEDVDKVSRLNQYANYFRLHLFRKTMTKV